MSGGSWPTSEVHRTNPSGRSTTHCRHPGCYDGNLTQTCQSGTVIVRSKTTHRSQRQFSQRTTALPWNLTSADAAKNGRDGDSGRSRVATDDQDNFRADRLHPMITNSLPNLSRHSILKACCHIADIPGRRGMPWSVGARAVRNYPGGDRRHCLGVTPSRLRIVVQR
jgi:hypothetical protein